MAKELIFTKDGSKWVAEATDSAVGYDADLADLAALVQEVQTGEGRP